jgi:nucleoid-associated protein YgaU
MTRETKIGLLVGLAFIIVIGILLSDHINSSTDPMRADATETFKSVENSVNAPEARPKGTDVVVAPKPVIPQDPVPVQPDSQPHPNSGQTIVAIGPGKDPSSIELPTRSNNPPTVQNDPVAQGDGNSGSQNTQTANNDQQKPTITGNGVSEGLVSAAKQVGEEVVSANGGSPVKISDPAPAAPAAATNVRQIKAEEGDTVSKLAAKYMGGNTKANRESIIKANPSVGTDGSKVFTGRMYTIPVVEVAKATPVQPVPASGNSQPPSQAKPEPIAAPPGTTWYTVKENDSLWKIATEQLGSGARWTEIKELNALQSADVRVNMRLKLPAKSVASNN